MHSLIVRAGIAGIAAAALLTACSSGSSAPTGSGGGSASTGSGGGSASDAAAAAGKKYSIGIVEFDGSDSTSQAMVVPLQADAEKDGYSVTTVDSEGDQGNAIAAIQTLVTKKVNLIFAPVYSPSQISAGLTAARAAGIPVVGMGGGTGPGMPISWDYVRAAGNEIAARIVKDTGGSGQLLEVTDTTFPVCEIRGQELADALKSTSIKADVQQMQSSNITGSSQNDTSAWLQQHPKGSGGNLIVWACADSIATGVITAVKLSNRTDVAVYSMGGELPELEDVQSGLIKADVYVDMAGAGHQLAAQVPAIVAAGVNAAPKEVVIATQMIDASNVKAFLTSHSGQLSQ